MVDATSLERPRAGLGTAARLAAVLALVLSPACGGPTSPTPAPRPTPVPVPTATPVPMSNAPTVGCPNPVLVAAPSNAPVAVTYVTPGSEGGQDPVTVACTPASGSLFPIGTTKVECVATDALERTGACAFPVTVAAPAALSLTRFMAFGDSITAGEVTVPVTGIFPAGQAPVFPLVLVPSAAYPTVLEELLEDRYPSQVRDIAVINEGKSGEFAADGPARFSTAFGADQPQAVLLMDGYNDICCGQGGQGIDAGLAGLSTMAAEARNRGARVFIATLAPSTTGSRAAFPDVLDRYNAGVRDVARGEGAVLVDIHAALLPDAAVNIGPDGLHPTEAGYRRMAEAFLAAIEAALQQVP